MLRAPLATAIPIYLLVLTFQKPEVASSIESILLLETTLHLVITVIHRLAAELRLPIAMLDIRWGNLHHRHAVLGCILAWLFEFNEDQSVLIGSGTREQLINYVGLNNSNQLSLI